MKSFMTFIGSLFVLAIIAAVFYGGYLAIGYVWQLFAALDPTLRLILLSSFAVFLAGCFVLAGAIKSGGHAAKIKGLQDARLALYKSLMENYRPCLEPDAQPANQLYNEILGGVKELQTDMQLLSSNAVLESHGKLIRALQDREDQSRLNGLFQKLVKNIRQDLGHGSGYDEKKLKFLFPQNQNRQEEESAQEMEARPNG